MSVRASPEVCTAFPIGNPLYSGAFLLETDGFAARANASAAGVAPIRSNNRHIPMTRCFLAHAPHSLRARGFACASREDAR